MAIEAIKTAAMAYQGSAPVAAAISVRPEKENITFLNPPAEISDTDEAPTVDLEEEEFTPDERKQQQKVPQENIGGGQNNKQLQEAVEKLKKKMQEQTEAIFGIHEGTNRVMIKIVDKDTKDVIKEYPPEKTLDMIQKVWEMAGIMVDEKR